MDATHVLPAEPDEVDYRRGTRAPPLCRVGDADRRLEKLDRGDDDARVPVPAVPDRGPREPRREEPRALPEMRASEELHEQPGARDPRRGVRVAEARRQREDEVRVVRAQQPRRPRRLQPADEAVERGHRPEPQLLARLDGRVRGGPAAAREQPVPVLPLDGPAALVQVVRLRVLHEHLERLVVPAAPREPRGERRHEVRQVPRGVGVPPGEQQGLQALERLKAAPLGPAGPDEPEQVRPAGVEDRLQLLPVLLHGVVLRMRRFLAGPLLALSVVRTVRRVDEVVAHPVRGRVVEPWGGGVREIVEGRRYRGL